MLWAAAFIDGMQALPNCFRAFRRISEAFEQSAHVKAGPGGDDGKLAAFAEIGENSESAAAIFARRENLFWLDQINEVMRNSLLLRYWNLSGADIEMAVDLGGIADENFTIQFFCEFDAQHGFTGSGGAEDNDQRREATHPENFQ